MYSGGLGALSLLGQAIGSRLSYLAQRMGARVDTRYYEGTGTATPSTVEIDVARGRGPFICTQMVVDLPAANGGIAQEHRLDISRGATSFLDGKISAELFTRSGYIMESVYTAQLPNLIQRHAPFVLDQDTLSVFAEPYSFGTSNSAWTVQLAGFHTDQSFATYVQSKLGELGAATVELGNGSPLSRTLNLSRPLTVSSVLATTPLGIVGLFSNSALEIRRNTLQMFSRGFQTALVGTQAVYDLDIASESMAHAADQKDLYEFRAENVSNPGFATVTLAGARVYTR